MRAVFKEGSQIRILTVIAILFLMQCKNQEKVAEGPPDSDNPCLKLTYNLPDSNLAFVAEAESDSEDIASQKARKKTVIQLVQFFQDEFIEDSQTEIFGGGEQSGGLNEFRKKWAETSFEMIGELHNQNDFTHRQVVTQNDSGIFHAADMLTVSRNWIRNHWEKTLKATDPAVFSAVNKKNINPIRELETHNSHSCENNS